MTSFQELQRRIGGFPIEYPAAALMAAAVAFITFALPDWRFESAINATGLPGIVSAAQPPLGTTARILAALGLGALSFLVVWFGLRALDAKPQTGDFPAFRAADSHPDAPRRRPILAGAEFGAPVDALPPIEEQIGRRRPVVTEPLPSFLAPQTPEPVRRRSIISEPVEKVEPATRMPEPAPVRNVDDERRVEPEALAEEELPEEIVSARFDAPEREAELSRESPSPFGEPQPEPEPEPEPRPRAVLAGDHDEEEESVSALMARLENGLSKRDSRPVPGPSGSAKEELRRAMGDLDRVSGRG